MSWAGLLCGEVIIQDYTLEIYEKEQKKLIYIDQSWFESSLLKGGGDP